MAIRVQYEAANKGCFSINGLGLENCSCSLSWAAVSTGEGVIGVEGVVVAVVGKTMEAASSVIVAALMPKAPSCKGGGWMVVTTAGLEGDRIGDSSEEPGEDGEAMEEELVLSEFGDAQSVSCFDTLRLTLALLF